jgi:hypothetical protein
MTPPAVPAYLAIIRNMPDNCSWPFYLFRLISTSLKSNHPQIFYEMIVIEREQTSGKYVYRRCQLERYFECVVIDILVDIEGSIDIQC